MIDPFDTYSKYIAIKLTFDIGNSYDYFLYGGKTKQKKETFLKRKDKYHFYALAKKLNDDERDIEAYLFVNLVHNPEYWIGNLLTEECMTRFRRFSKYSNNYSYALSEELKHVQSLMEKQQVSVVELLSAQKSVPKIMEWTFAEMVTPMVLHSINRVVPIFTKWMDNKDMFEPLLTEPLHRMVIFGNFARRYSHHLTKKEIANILNSTIMMEESNE